jgi:hypothetical protein
MLLPALFSAFSLSLVCAPVSAFAHEDGASFEKTVGAYRVDIGYGEARANASATFDLKLTDAKTGSIADFDDAWVRIERDGATYFAGPIANMEFGKPTFTIVFAEPGEYSIAARFVKGTTVLAEADFPYEVAGLEDQTTGRAGESGASEDVLMAIAAAALAGALFFFIGRFTASRA